jgi:hypothetical protein
MIIASFYKIKKPFILNWMKGVILSKYKKIAQITIFSLRWNYPVQVIWVETK